MITIELNTESTPFFALPEGKLHLSIANPGPVVLDASQLTEQDKNIINNAHALSKVIICKSEDENSKPKAVPSPKADYPSDEAVVSRDRDVMLDKVKDMLKLNANTLKTTIKNSDDPVLLRLLKECEEKGKKRNGVLKVLNSKISDLQAQVLKAVGGTDAEGKYSGDPVRVNSEIVSDIEDSEFEEVEVRATSEKDFEQE